MFGFVKESFVGKLDIPSALITLILYFLNNKAILIELYEKPVSQHMEFLFL